MTRHALLLPVVMTVLYIAGCGLRPPAGIPSDATPADIIDSIERRTGVLQDFTGSARAEVRSGDGRDAAQITVRFRRPDDYLVSIRGAFGVEIAAISAADDSMMVYMPYFNGFLLASRDEQVLGKLIPDLDFDFNRLTALFTGTLPPRSEIDSYAMTLIRHRDDAVLTLERDGDVRSYTVKGPEMRLVRERVEQEGALLWDAVYNEYAECGDREFPRDITVSSRDRRLSLDFIRCSVNGGLSDGDLTIILPDDAERLYLKPADGDGR